MGFYFHYIMRSLIIFTLISLGFSRRKCGFFLSFFLFNSFSISTVYDCLVLLFLPASNDFQISLFPPTPYYKRRTVNKNLDIALNGATKS